MYTDTIHKRDDVVLADEETMPLVDLLTPRECQLIGTHAVEIEHDEDDGQFYCATCGTCLTGGAS